MNIRVCLITVFAMQMSVYSADVLDCSKKSLAQELAKIKDGETVRFTGVCTGPFTLRTGNLALAGSGDATITGGLIISGASNVALSNFEVRNGSYGILAQNGAHISLDQIVVRNNSLIGISLQTASSAVIKNSTVKDNTVHGLDLETGSAATIAGTLSVTGNHVFGINVNGSSITFANATLTASGNVLGMQVATAANAFLNDSSTTLNFTNNLATGLTVVSGAHLVSFGGKINATGNGAFGVSVNSKGGLDLDAASVLTASNNQAGGVAVQQNSVVTVFNNTQNSGAPGSSTIIAQSNGGNGVAVLTGSQFTMVNQAAMTSSSNGAFGLLVDNGSGATVRNTTLTGNTARDLQMTFGSRLDGQSSLTAGTRSCDATVLVRGVSFTCPQ